MSGETSGKALQFGSGKFQYKADVTITIPVVIGTDDDFDPKKDKKAIVGVFVERTNDVFEKIGGIGVSAVKGIMKAKVQSLDEQVNIKEAKTEAKSADIEYFSLHDTTN